MLALRNPESVEEKLPHEMSLIRIASPSIAPLFLKFQSYPFSHERKI